MPTRPPTSRLRPDMSLQDAVLALSERVTGSLLALMTAAENSPRIDPNAAAGVWAPLLALDLYGITGSNIWQLWKDVCRENVVHFLAVLRAAQLGLVDVETVVGASQDPPTATLDPVDLLAKVKARLPKFAAEP